jgi:hypothetical protein
MPHRRPPKKGSFGAHFDELVKHFHHDRPAPKPGDEDGRPAKGDRDNVHDRLFESAWRKAREEHRLTDR